MAFRFPLLLICINSKISPKDLRRFVNTEVIFLLGYIKIRAMQVLRIF